MLKKRLLLTLVYVLPTAALVALAGWDGFYLPGTQPDPDLYFQTAELCRYCHGEYDLAKEPYFNWRGGMMSQSARDPLFRAALTIAEQDVPGAGQFCWRCHSPTGWLGGRTEPFDGSNLTETDLDGVQCDVCHRMVSPRSREGRLLTDPDVPGYGNGMYVISPDTAKRGPRDDSVANHGWVYSRFHETGKICGTCHDVSNPLQAVDPVTQRPYEYFPITRVYSEWELSEYGRMGHKGACQTCHMPELEGKACYFEHAPTRPDLVVHSQVGANYWVPEILPMFWDYEPIHLDALWVGRQRAIEMLRRAAKLSFVKTPAETPGQFTVRVLNTTGHKLPTGDEARRMWLNVQFLDAGGRVLAESGGYNFETGELSRDPQAKVYEAKPGIRGVGPTFHMLLNNTYFKDNRIPPRGFNNAAFAERLMAPVGATYADGQYWDDTTYQVPPGTARVRVTLYYQTVTKEYIEFLRDENRTDDWGRRLYEAWLATRKCPPVPIATLTYPKDAQPPSAPGHLQATAVSYSRIRLTWNAAQDNDAVIYYEIWRKEPGNNRFRWLGTTARAETEFLDAGLQPDQTYIYYVKAIDTAGNVSERSNEASARTGG